MATIKPRLQVLLNPRTKAVVEGAASQMGVSASKLVSDILDQALPAIRSMGDAFEEIRRDQVAGLDIYKKLVVDARQLAADAQLDIEDVISSSKAPKIDSQPLKAASKPKPKPKAKTKPKA